MSDEDSDSEILIDPSREKKIQQEILSSLEILNQKTVNFEDLLNEFVRRGCLSFEEKFKILSGIVDQNTANKTIPEKCNELYQTLLRKQIPWAKIIRCWEDTGNNYLVGRFDTHFSIEGRESKSLKFSKFKALPSHRTEFLTHLSLKNLQLSPRSLLKCLRKSSRLESIRLDRVKVPYGGREADDPSSDFEVPLMLPNLKEFYLEEVTKHEPFKSLKEINTFLDELNLKPMLFFGLNSNMAWDAGIYIHVKIRGVNVLKMQPNRLLFPDDKFQDIEEPHYISMLRRRPVEFGGFINPNNCPKISLYEVYIPKQPFPLELTHLVLYRCRITNFDSFISPCPNLVKVSLYGEFDSSNVSQLSLSSFSKSKDSLTELSIGCLQLNADVNSEKLNLDLLCVDCCLIANNSESESPSLLVSDFFESIKKIILLSCSDQLIINLINSKNILKCNSISVHNFSWNEDLRNDECGRELLEQLVTQGLNGRESNFLLENKNDDSGFWNAKKCSIDQMIEVFEAFGWNPFCQSGNLNGWFDVPLKTSDKKDKENETEMPRNVFRQKLGF